MGCTLFLVLNELQCNVVARDGAALISVNSRLVQVQARDSSDHADARAICSAYSASTASMVSASSARLSGR